MLGCCCGIVFVAATVGGGCGCTIVDFCGDCVDGGGFAAVEVVFEVLGALGGDVLGGCSGILRLG